MWRSVGLRFSNEPGHMRPIPSDSFAKGKRQLIASFAGHGRLNAWVSSNRHLEDQAMEHGSPSLADQLASCQQRIRALEQMNAQQQAVIAQRQEVIAACQEQLAQAAEQLRFFRRAMFGQRRERYAPSADQKLLFVPEAVEGVGAKEQSIQETSTEPVPPRVRRKPRRPRIEFPQFWEHRRTEYRLPPAELPCGCCGTPRAITRTHVTKRLEWKRRSCT